MYGTSWNAWGQRHNKNRYNVNGDMVGTLNTEHSGALVVNQGQRFFAYYTYSFKNITNIHLNVQNKYNKQYRYLSI